VNPRSQNKASVHPRLRTKLRELAADTILEAAEQAFAELGLAAGMDAIATRAGVSVGTLYNHFRDRDTLVDAVFEARQSALLERVQRAVQESDMLPFRQRLVVVLEAVHASVAPNARFRQVFLLAELRKPRKKAIAERFGAALLPVLEQGQREGEVRPDPHQLHAAFLMGLLHTAFVMSYDHPNRLPRDRVAALVVEQFLDGARGVQP
jgi:AcrR family transcriptional regulator